MPQISRSGLAAKLQEIPEGARAPYLKQLREKGYTWETTPEPSLAQSAIKLAKETGAQSLGATVGSTIGTPAGPLGRVAGAALGGAGGKGAQMIGEYAAGTRDPMEGSPLSRLKEIGAAGLAEGGAEAGFMGLGKMVRALGPGAMKISAAVPEKYGKALFEDPDIINRAITKKESGAAYDAFERYTGLQGLQNKLVTQENRATIGVPRLERMVLTPANQIEGLKGVPKNLQYLRQKPTPQDLYTASQAASRLKLMGKFGDPQAAMAASSSSIGQGKNIADKALEDVYPEYKTLRKQHFEAKAKEATDFILPHNKDGTTNVLRPALALHQAAVGSTGAGLPFLSPKVWQTLVRLIPSLSKAGKAAGRTGAAATADELAQPEDLP